MKPCCEPRQELPITTGRVGLSQSTGRLYFYDGNPTGTAHLVAEGWWKWDCPPRWQPWPPPQWGCKPWAGGCGCGGSCGGNCGCGCDPCRAGANCFAQLMTDPLRWYCYYRNLNAVQLLTNPNAGLAAA